MAEKCPYKKIKNNEFIFGALDEMTSTLYYRIKVIQCYNTNPSRTL